MSKSTEKKEEKPNYETPVVVKLDDVAIASGQGSCITGSAAAAFLYSRGSGNYRLHHRGYDYNRLTCFVLVKTEAVLF